VSAYVDQHRERFGVEPIGETLGVSASAYYRRATGERSARQLEDERLLGVIGETHKANYDAYGYRRMWKALTRAGEPVARCQVQRLMAEHGIQGAKRRGRPWRTTKADPSAPVEPRRACASSHGPGPHNRTRCGCRGALSTLSDPGEYDPFGVVSALR